MNIGKIYLTPTWLRSLELLSSCALVGHIVSEVTGVLTILLVRVEHQAVRAERPPTVPVLTRPELVALLGIGE